MNECIDVHSHFLPRNLLQRLEEEGERYESPVRRDARGQIFVLTPERPYGPIGPGFFDIDVRCLFLDKHEISRQVLMAPPFLFYYWTDPQKVYELIQIENDAIAEWITSNPTRFLGLATIPLQDCALAVKECERIKQLGLSGVEIGSNVNGMDLDSESLLPFFEAAESLDLAILIHPNNVVGRERMQDYHLRNLIGFPSDTTLAAAKLIFAGVLERFPKLRICLGQAGGFLPYIIGRLDNGYRARPECRRNISKPPSAYISQLYFDSLIFESAAFAMLVNLAGPDRVMVGSDFPFDMGSESPLSILQTSPFLTGKSKRKIRFETAQHFLGL